MSKETQKEANEIKAAAQFARQGNPAQDVLSWLHQAHHGTLSTLSVKEETEGFPLGSIVPFALDRNGHPFIFIANIAPFSPKLYVLHTSGRILCLPVMVIESTTTHTLRVHI